MDTQYINFYRATVTIKLGIIIEDKSLLHKNHPFNQQNKFNIKISLKSKELKKMNRIESNKKIYNILDEELKKFIHSLQILID